MGMKSLSNLSEGLVNTRGGIWQLADTVCRCTGLTELSRGNVRGAVANRFVYDSSVDRNCAQS